MLTDKDLEQTPQEQFANANERMLQNLEWVLRFMRDYEKRHKKDK